MRFPYFELGPGDFAPIVPLSILGRDGWLGLEAYVDSGASVSIFQADRAELLGVPYQRGRKLRLTVGDGGVIEVYVHALRVELGGERFLADIGFSRQLGVGFNLLGRRSFFERFRICFDDTRRVVEFHPVLK